MPLQIEHQLHHRHELARRAHFRRDHGHELQGQFSGDVASLDAAEPIAELIGQGAGLPVPGRGGAARGGPVPALCWGANGLRPAGSGLRRPPVSVKAKAKEAHNLAPCARMVSLNLGCSQ